MRLRRLIQEIHRRSIWQVLAVYLFGAWIGYEVVLALVEGLALPPWLPGLAIVLFVIGLPIVVATALVQEGAPRLSGPDLHLLDDLELADDGGGQEEATGPVERPHGALHDILTWRKAFLGGVLAFALWGVVAAGWLVFGGATGVAVPAESVAVESDRTGILRVAVEPPGAVVKLRLIDAEGVAGPPHGLDGGSAEVDAGEYLIEVEHPDHNPLTLVAEVPTDSVVEVDARLAPAGAGTEGMALVPAGPAAGSGRVESPFLIDRHEVTNAEYLAFMAAGGYREPAYWPETLVIDGESMAWSAAVARLVDDTGIQAPRGWSGGIHPEGKAAHPVVGVTWYEAVAYLRWAGKELPTMAQWRRAALGDDSRLFPWGSAQDDIERRANFSLLDTRPVGSYPAGLSPFGVADMAGNVREWLKGEDRARKPVVGGSWLDPTYMFEQAESFAPGFSSNAIGFRGVRRLRTD